MLTVFFLKLEIGDKSLFKATEALEILGGRPMSHPHCHISYIHVHPICAVKIVKQLRKLPSCSRLSVGIKRKNKLGSKLFLNSAMKHYSLWQSATIPDRNRKKRKKRKMRTVVKSVKPTVKPHRVDDCFRTEALCTGMWQREENLVPETKPQPLPSSHYCLNKEMSVSRYQAVSSSLAETR